MHLLTGKYKAIEKFALHKIGSLGTYVGDIILLDN